MAAIPQDILFHIEIPGGSSKERTEREIVTRVVVTDDQQFLHKTAAFYTEQCTSPLLFQVISWSNLRMFWTMAWLGITFCYCSVGCDVSQRFSRGICTRLLGVEVVADDFVEVAGGSCAKCLIWVCRISEWVLALFPGRRRNGLANSTSSNCIRM